MRRFTQRTAIAAATLIAVGGASERAMADACGTTIGNPTDNATQVITTDTTWGGGANPSPICLEEPVYVGNGAATDVVLTILPGTIVRGQPKRAPNVTPIASVNNQPGALIVTRGSQLVADGSPTNPIIMTSAAVDNDNNGVCDNFDSGLGGPNATFKDPFPGLNPNIPAGCSLTGTCTTACTGGCVPLFCDDTPATAPLAPLDAAGADNVQLWGGLAMLGNAPTNTGNNEPGTIIGEGILEGVAVPATPVSQSLYGGFDPHDNSGVVRYVSVRHAGVEIAAANELNGVTLAGVGDGTIFEYVEVYNNYDDGFEWFGGTVNGSHLVVLYAGDDQFDIDQGYTGVLQYLFAAMPFFNETGGGAFGVSSGDRLGEWDNIDAANVNLRRDNDNSQDDIPWPMGNPYVWNLTGIGSVPDGSNPAVSDATPNFGLFLTAAFAGQITNSVVVNVGGNVCLECNASGGIGGMTCPTNAAADRVRLTASICADTGAPDATVIANGNAWAEQLTGNATDYDNLVTGADVLVAENAAGFTGQGGVDGKLPTGGVSPYNPRPTGTDLGLTPQDAGLDRAATYRGAFENGAPILWTTGWTAGNVAGLIAD